MSSLPDYNALVKVMKQAGVEAMGANGPVNVCFGKVMNTAPLKVLVDQKMTLGAAQLVLTRNVTDYEVEVTVEWETEKETSTHTHVIGDDEVETGTNQQRHMHDIKGKKKMLVHNSLVKGDELVLLRQQGGQKYIVIDRVGETT